MHRSVLFSLLFCVAILANGCQSGDEAVVIVPTIDVPAASTAVAELQPENSEPELAEAEAAATEVVEFTPPFPDRLELFEPPKRAQSTVRHNDEHGETVELKGFINVDRPKVVLSIDGVVSPVPEGGEKYGVQVIAIQPPTVVLQRGRDRWTATLE